MRVGLFFFFFFNFKLEQQRIMCTCLLADSKNATLFAYINLFSDDIYLACAEGWSADLHLNRHPQGRSVTICYPTWFFFSLTFHFDCKFAWIEASQKWIHNLKWFPVNARTSFRKQPHTSLGMKVKQRQDFYTFLTTSEAITVFWHCVQLLKSLHIYLNFGDAPAASTVLAVSAYSCLTGRNKWAWVKILPCQAVLGRCKWKRRPGGEDGGGRRRGPGPEGEEVENHSD